MPAPAPLTVSSPSPGDPELPSTLTYFAERRAAGCIGILLPVIVVVYDRLSMSCVPTSISASYHTDARNVFVGSLCAVGVFLICSIGYKEDKWWSILAGVLAVVVAFCPTNVDGACKVDGPSDPTWTANVHGVAACALFLVFTYFCLVLFTRTKPTGSGQPRRLLRGLPAPKKHRNLVYLLCGGTMLAAIIVFVVFLARYKLWNLPPPTYLVLGVEWVCLSAFGIAWLVKGQQLLKD
jgi:hypothetical protein